VMLFSLSGAVAYLSRGRAFGSAWRGCRLVRGWPIRQAKDVRRSSPKRR